MFVHVFLSYKRFFLSRTNYTHQNNSHVSLFVVPIYHPNEVIIVPVLSGMSGSGNQQRSSMSLPRYCSLLHTATPRCNCNYCVCHCGGCDVSFFGTELTSDEEVGSAYWAGVLMKVTVSSLNCGFAVARTVG